MHVYADFKGNLICFVILIISYIVLRYNDVRVNLALSTVCH